MKEETVEKNIKISSAPLLLLLFLCRSVQTVGYFSLCEGLHLDLYKLSHAMIATNCRLCSRIKRKEQLRHILRRSSLSFDRCVYTGIKIRALLIFLEEFVI
jgi:hypothetical protein